MKKHLPVPTLCSCSFARSVLLQPLFSAFSILYFLAPTALAQTPPCAAPGTNLVAWWPGENHAYNVVNQRAASLQGNVTYADGRVGRAFSFDGSGKVRVLEAPTIDLSRTNRWTLTAWVRPASIGGATSRIIYTEGNRIAALALQAGTGKFESWINGAHRLESDLGAPEHEWTHVALVLDRATRVLYVNGLPAGIADNTPATNADSSGAALGGATTDDPAAAFLGELDEVTLHRRALTAGEVAALYASGGTGWCVGEDGGPLLLIEPASQAAPIRGTVTFNVLAHGSPPPTYQWLFNDVLLVGETNLNLVLSSVTPAHNGLYRVAATSGGRTVTSAAAELSVEHCTATPTNLVAWWPADGTALEFRGQHHGAIWNEVAFPDGMAGRSFAFDGQSSFVAVPDHPSLSPQAAGNGELTVEVWVRLAALPSPDPSTGQNRRVLLAKGDPGRWEYGLSVSTTGVPEFFVWTPDGTDHAAVAAGQLLLNQWHHLAATYQRGQSLKLYQDGQLMAETASFTGQPGDTGSPLYLGRRGDAQFFAGQIDEPALYSRALRAEEIAAMSAAGGVGKCYGGGPQPVFVQEPHDVTAFLLNTAILEGLALGTPRPSVQWYFAGDAVPDATNSTLILNGLTPAQAGLYVLVASNSWGVTSSRSTTLTLLPFASTVESFELGWNGWSTDNYSIWEMGQPTSGPGAAHSGSSCAATVLGGDYPDGYEARLVSPTFTVPSVDQNPRLRFWHWHNLNCYDYGQVQVREGNGPWTPISDGYSSTSLDRWSRATFDLKPYAGKTIQVGFFFHSHSGWDCDSSWNYEVAPGWYIDELTVETGPLPVLPALEGFEEGWGGWTVQFSGGAATEFGLWEIGTPTTGPGSAYSGTNCAATVLGGDYPEWYEARLISPAMVVPSVDQNPRLRFWHWYNLNCYDYGQVQVREGNGPWTPISDGYSSTSLDRWSRATFDLKAYAGKTIQVGFFFHSHSGWDCDSSWNHEVAPGWYIDDMMIQVGNIGLAEVAPVTVDEKTPVTVRVNPVGANADSLLSFTLPWAPAGAWIDPETGVFSWTPSERQGPATHRIPVHVVDYGHGEANEMTVLAITVNEVNEPSWLLPASVMVRPGQFLRLPLFSGDRDYPPNALEYTMTGAPIGAALDRSAGVLQWSAPADSPPTTYRINVTLNDHGLPPFTTNAIVTVAVSPHPAPRLTVRPATEHAFEFTIEDSAPNSDYLLQAASPWVDQASWRFQEGAVPDSYPVVEEEDYLENLGWGEFVAARLQRTAWTEVLRVSPVVLPHVFVAPVPDAWVTRARFYRVIRVAR